MRHSPKISKLISKIFGFTNVAAYGRQLTFRRLLKFVPMNEMKTILDLGCGEGEFSFMLADAHKNSLVHAVDIDAHAVAKIQQAVDRFNIKNIKTYNCKIDQLENNYYDLIFSVDLFQHIPENEMPFKECFNKLKKGGYLVTKMPNKKHIRILPESWFREFDDTVKGDNADPENKYIPHFGQVFDLHDLVEKYRENNFKIITAFFSDGVFARAGWELNYLMKKGGPALHLLSLPPSKLLMKIDKLFKNNTRGNYIQVVGQKI